MIACFGETTGARALQRISEQMRSSEEGAKILTDKPRINSKSIDLDALGRLPPDSFGFAYKKFLDDNVIFIFCSILLLEQTIILIDICMFSASDARLTIQCEILR